jgi:hypothetical protein
LFTWQLAQATVVCLPVKGNGVLLWLNDDGIQAVLLWHTSHCCGNPDWTWFGLVVALKFFKWQEEQAVLFRL